MLQVAVNSQETAAPAGPYSHAIRAGDFVFLSGQVALDGVTGKLVAEDISSQTEQVFRNLKAVLRAAAKRWPTLSA